MTFISEHVVYFRLNCNHLSGAFFQIYLHTHTSGWGRYCFAQGLISMWTGEVRDQTTNPTINGRPSLPTEPQNCIIIKTFFSPEQLLNFLCALHCVQTQKRVFLKSEHIISFLGVYLNLTLYRELTWLDWCAVWNWDAPEHPFMWSELNEHWLSWMVQQAGETQSDITAFQNSLQPCPLGGKRTTVYFLSDATSDLYARLGTYTRCWYPDNISVGTFQFDVEGRFCPFSEAVVSVTECLYG